VPVLAAPDLVSLLNHLKGTTRLPEPQPGEVEAAAPGPDLKQVKGQEVAKRALEIAAAGGHNLLMIGPPGAGKSLMAACLPGILPPLSVAEALEVSMVASVAGTLEEGRISRARPFRSPHHSASMAARGYTRMLRVAGTIADLAGSAGIGRIHVAEALSYRRVVSRS
jgi:magnesium chelatase family protein